MKILLVDNYDSFTYNIVHAIKKIGIGEVFVRKNDEIELEEVDEYDKIILSPGPGLPIEAGILLDLIRHYAVTKSILGICLGHQAIGEAFGASLYNLENVFHGVQSIVTLIGRDPILDGLPHQIEVGRYHSWAILPASLPACLTATMVSEDGCIMAVKHQRWDVHGVQFHPESILTPYGEQIIRNFLQHTSKKG